MLFAIGTVGLPDYTYSYYSASADSVSSGSSVVSASFVSSDAASASVVSVSSAAESSLSTTPPSTTRSSGLMLSPYTGFRVASKSLWRVTAQCKVTVNYKDDNGTSELPEIPEDKNTPFVKPKSIKLSKTSITINDKNKDYCIKTTFSPENATTKACRWTCSDNSVVRVNIGWPTIFSESHLTPVSNGTAVLTAHALDGSGVIAKCVVTVNCF